MGFADDFFAETKKRYQVADSDFGLASFWFRIVESRGQGQAARFFFSFWPDIANNHCDCFRDRK